jgi:hypothetical protein
MVTSSVVFLILAYAFKVLEPEDCDRFKVVSDACPRALATPMNYLLDRFTRRIAADSTAV